MHARTRLSISSTAIFITACFAFTATADESCVRFDIPSVVASCDVTTEEILLENQRLVEIVIPVSALIGCDNNKSVMEMMIQVRALGSGMQVDDYSPRTQLYSDVDGTVAVEQNEQTNSSIGIDASGNIADSVRLNGKVGTGKTKGASQRFQRIPEQKLLLASGTISRGNGVYFKFRHSPQTTLEGGHEIAITLRVPLTWRGGMLRIDCLASGTEKYFMGESEFTAGNDSFVVATWLKGDLEAQQIVEQYSRFETKYRKFAATVESRELRKRQQDPIGQLFGSGEPGLPEGWASRFMLYDTRSFETRIKPHLPAELQRATDQFLASRRSVLRLAR